MTVLHMVLQTDTTASGWAVVRDRPAALFAPLVAVSLLMIVLGLVMGFVREARQEPPQIETHWGGLGGGLGGWRISASLAYLVAALAFGGMFTAFSTRWLFPPPPQTQENETQKDEQKSKADTTPEAPPAAGPLADTTGRGARSSTATPD